MSRHTGKVLTYTAIINEIWGAADLNGIKKLQANENHTMDISWYDENLEVRTLEALEEISARYGFHDKREAVAEALREAKLPIAYAMVDTIGEVWLMDLTEVLEK